MKPRTAAQRSLLQSPSPQSRVGGGPGPPCTWMCQTSIYRTGVILLASPRVRAVSPGYRVHGDVLTHSECMGDTCERAHVGDPAAHGGACCPGGLPRSPPSQQSQGSRVARYSPGAAKGPPSWPIGFYCSREPTGQVWVPCARLHVGAEAPRSWARQVLAHLALKQEVKGSQEQGRLPELYYLQKIPLARLPLHLPPPARLSLEIVISGPEAAWTRIKARAWRLCLLCPTPETRRQEPEGCLSPDPPANNWDGTCPSSGSGTEHVVKWDHFLEEGLTVAERWPA